MIRLALGNKPKFLQKFGDKLISTIMAATIKGKPLKTSVKYAYRHREIKEAVLEETNGKCAYCESKVPHVYPGDVEHIIPKEDYPRLTLTWSNLTYACYWCNNSKRRYFGKREQKLLNPFRDDIEKHLIFVGPLILHINNSMRGELTWKKLKLNRTQLVEKRMEKILEIQKIKDRINLETNPAIIKLLEEEIIEFTLPYSEFSYSNYCFIENY